MDKSQRSLVVGLIAFCVPVVTSMAGCGSSPNSGTQATVSPPAADTLPTAGGTAGTSILPTQPMNGNLGMPMLGGAVGNTPASGTAGTAANPMMTGAAGANANAGVAGATSAPSDSLYDATTHELRAPAPSDGVQIKTSVFELKPGEEKFTCYHAEIPIDGEIDVRYYESTMAQGSHHFILYRSDGDTTPVGTMDPSGCQSNFTNWIYSSAQPHIDLRMPEGVAFVLGSRQRVQFDMHYINTTQDTLQAHVTLNVIQAKGKFEKAASLISFNAGIFLQPNDSQTVEGDCTPGDGAKFFYMLTHTHRRGQLATIDRVLADGSLGERLVKSTDWEHPDEEKWLKDPYLTFKTGEKFHYTCQYMNDIDQVVTAGPSAATNEMCMAITYYFPASAGGSCL